MVHRSHRGVFTRVLGGALLLLQLSLLGNAALHQHSDFSFARGRVPASAGENRGSGLPAAIDWTLCPVCQIMRLSAARPATASNTNEPKDRLFDPPAPHGTAVFSDLPALLYGRAPPQT